MRRNIRWAITVAVLFAAHFAGYDAGTGGGWGQHGTKLARCADPKSGSAAESANACFDNALCLGRKYRQRRRR